MKKFDFIVFIGRFQPFHNGHLSIVQRALKESENVIILCGSAHQPRSVKNPWYHQERAAMILNSLGGDKHRVHISPLSDIAHSDVDWVKSVEAIVNGIATAYTKKPGKQSIGIIGHSKDQSSFYLKLFPFWGMVEAGNHESLNSTTIREEYFTTAKINTEIMPESVCRTLKEMAYSNTWEEIRKQMQAHLSNKD